MYQVTENNGHVKRLIKLAMKPSLNHFFFIWVFLHEYSQITGLQEKGEGISLTPYSKVPNSRGGSNKRGGPKFL